MEPTTFVHAHYSRERPAVRAVEALIAAGFPQAEIGAFNARLEPEAELEITHVKAVPLEALIGAAIGALLGAAVGGGGLFGFQSWFFGAVIGAALGMVVGWLGGIGVWRKTLRFSPDAFGGADVIVGVNTHGVRAQHARQLLEHAGGTNADVAAARAVRGVRRYAEHDRGWARTARSRGH